ncbi:cation diffusion facilitator family transporter [Xanthobacter sp. TB0139]|uniref:cation diffusion facilitator family transporter n=1 Tax=Xanthobacter sp. TB0139 TaxID=3459178 RepID=UPI00403A58C7
MESKLETKSRWNEQNLLGASIAVTLVVAGVGVLFGLISGSLAIAFDAVYSLIDASMSVLALFVSRLIVASVQEGKLSRRLRNRFTMGFWHLEPIVLGLNGTILLAIAVYALINAITSLLDGGNALVFDEAILYALFATLVCMAMAVVEHLLNRQIRSDFVALDVRSWFMAGCISAALLLAFCIGYAVQGTSYAWTASYVDPFTLVIVSLFIIPMPIGTIRQAFAEILLVTPQALKNQVDEVAADVMERHGFLDYRAYVAKVGRVRQVELWFVAPAHLPARTLEEWDAIRAEIGSALGPCEEGQDSWLTISFTADPDWAQ